MPDKERAMTANEDGMAPVGGVVAVLRERDYELIARTLRFWVFRSKNPQSYAFVLPARNLVPVEVVRCALHFEPLDVDAAIERAMVKSASGEVAQYEYEQEPPEFDVEEALRKLRETPLDRVEISKEDMKITQAFTDRVVDESSQIRDEDRIDISGNIKRYLYERE
jgi:hypothetical protein